jgi:hypothetical protein
MSALRTYNYDVQVLHPSGEEFSYGVVAAYTLIGNGWVTFKNDEHASVLEIPEHRIIYIQRGSLVDEAV